MREVVFLILVIWMIGGPDVMGQAKKPPARLVLQSEAGDILFKHNAHVKREKGGCKVCHDKLWPEAAKVPVTSSAGCRTCHHSGGKAFEMKGNCNKCHGKAAAHD
jgi:c(7)-type cytochrome triheme protein